MDKIELLVKRFIEIVKEEYAHLYIDYEINEKNGEFDIWHNGADLQFNNKEFQIFIGKLIQQLFYQNNCFNFSFGYDGFKSMLIEQKQPIVVSNPIYSINKLDACITESMINVYLNKNINMNINHYKMDPKLFQNVKRVDINIIDMDSSYFKDEKILLVA